MNSTDVDQSPRGAHREKRKPYIPPTCRRVTPEAAKEFLLREADLTDPEVTHMLQCIEELQKASR